MAPAPVPTLELAGPSGSRITVAPRSPDDRIGELADALGLAPAADLEVDGRPVTRYESIRRAGVRRGSHIGPARPARAAAEPVVVATCDAGPAAGVVVHLAPGRHVVGRSPRAAVRIDDPLLEPHHGVLDVVADGTASFLQLTGRVPCRIDGVPVAGPTVVPDGGVVTLAASRIRVAAAGAGPGAAGPGDATLAAIADDPWRRVLQRSPRTVPQWRAVPIVAPVAGATPPRPGAMGIAAAGLAAVAATVIALVMGSALFLVFAAAGLFASTGVWLVTALGARRARSASRAAWQADVVAFGAAVEAHRLARARYHDATTPDVVTAVEAARALRGDLWRRRSGHPDLHRVSLGRGSVELHVELDRGTPDPLAPELAAVAVTASRLDDVTVPVVLGPGAALALAGPHAVAVARALVVQLVVWCGPADIQLVVVAGDPTAWDWCRWLPHAAGPDGPRVVAADDTDRLAAMLGALDDGAGRHVVVVTDRADALSQRTGPLRRYLGSAPSAAVLAVLGSEGSTPAMCHSILEVGSLGGGRWWPDASADGHPVPVHVAGLTDETATAVARVLAGLVDPEDPVSSGLAPIAVTVGRLAVQHGPAPIDDPIAIAAGWRAAGDDPAPVAALGTTADGLVAIDLARDGPHALIAGTTGSGKSELLRTLVVGMAARCSPDHVTFVLVDYKGGSTFDACADLPHTVGLVTDLDDELAARALASLDAEVRRREHVLRGSGAVDLTDHRARGGAPLPRLVVVIDEFATLAAELPDFLGALVGVAQRGRSLGIHLVLATQRPAGVVSDDIRANTNLRIALRLQDVADARDVVGHDAPVSFPRGAPGRAMLRLGADEHILFHAARSSGPAAVAHDDRLHVVAEPDPDGGGESELAVLVRTIRNAAALSDVARPHRPWLPPLPASLSAADVAVGAGADGAAGLVDDPANQCRRPLRWSPEDGNLAIVGSLGSGTTTALGAAVTAVMGTRRPSQCHVYVVDGRGDPRLHGIAAAAHCGGVLRLHERERLSRLFRRLTAELDGRRAEPTSTSRCDIVLAVDGMPAVRTALDDPLDHGDVDRLGRLVADGPAVGIVTVLTAERPAALPAAFLATCATRWIGRLDDAAEATVCGVAPRVVPRCGPGRFVVARSGLQAQVVHDPDMATVPSGPGGPPPLGALPVTVTTMPGGSLAGGDAGLVIGVDFESLGPAVLAVPDGEHVLVAGPPRSGRTTALAALVASWRALHPDGSVSVVASSRPGPWPGADVTDLDAALATLAGRVGGRPAMLVVDDADRVDDPRLGALAQEHGRGLLIAAAGRPDALRPLYGHWTTVVRRSRLGVLLAGCADIDGDLLGELLPRRPPIPARPGLAWLVDAGGRRLAQIAS